VVAYYSFVWINSTSAGMGSVGWRLAIQLYGLHSILITGMGRVGW
jgi:hypothetical protein